MTFKSRGEVFQRELKPVSDAGMDDLNILFLQNPCLPPVHLHRLHRRGQQKILQVYLFHTKRSLSWGQLNGWRCTVTPPCKRRYCGMIALNQILRTRDASSGRETKWRATTSGSSAPCWFTAGTTVLFSYLSHTFILPQSPLKCNKTIYQ